MKLTSARIALIALALLLAIAVPDRWLHDRKKWLTMLRAAVVIHALGWLWFALLRPSRQGVSELQMTLFRRVRECFVTPYGFWESLSRWIRLGLKESGFPYRKWYLFDDVWNNLTVLIPAGYLLPAAFPALRGRRFPWRAVGVLALLSALTEFSQYVAVRGSSDINDVLNNTLSAMAGAGVWAVLRGRIWRRRETDRGGR